MRIRRYTEVDKIEILSLLASNIPVYFAEEETKDLIHYLDHFADNYFIVELGDKILGAGGFNLTEDNLTAKISWDIVDAFTLRQGIGSSLMLYRLEQILKIPSITTVSVRTSQMVYQFYEKFGLILREIIPDYWAKGFDMYRLDCPIQNIILSDSSINYLQRDK